MKIVIAYWPSRWQAATSNETVIDLVFGVYTSREKAMEAIRSNVSQEEWEDHKDEFVYEDLEIDEYHPIPHI